MTATAHWDESLSVLQNIDKLFPADHEAAPLPNAFERRVSEHAKDAASATEKFRRAVQLSSEREYAAIRAAHREAAEEAWAEFVRQGKEQARREAHQQQQSEHDLQLRLKAHSLTLALLSLESQKSTEVSFFSDSVLLRHSSPKGDTESANLATSTKIIAHAWTQDKASVIAKVILNERKHWTDHRDAEDLKQIGLAKLWLVLVNGKFKPVGRDTFKAFAARVMENAMRDYAKSEWRKGHRAEIQAWVGAGKVEEVPLIGEDELPSDVAQQIAAIPNGEKFIREVLDGHPMHSDPQIAKVMRYRVRQRAKKKLTASVVVS